MTKKRKAGILLILVGVGISLVLFFFQDRYGDIKLIGPLFKTKHYEVILDPKVPEEAREIKSAKFLEKLHRAQEGQQFDEKYMIKTDEKGLVHVWERDRVETFGGIEIPYRIFLAVGIILVLIGIGMVTFSFFPKKENSTKQ